MGCTQKNAPIQSIIYQIPKSKQYQTTKNTIMNDQKKTLQRFDTKEDQTNNLINKEKRIQSTQFLYSNLPRQSKTGSTLDTERIAKNKINDDQIEKNRVSFEVNTQNLYELRKSLKSKTIHQQRKLKYDNDSMPSVPQSFIKAIAEYDQTNYDELNKYLDKFDDKIPAQINMNKKGLQKGELTVKIHFN